MKLESLETDCLGLSVYLEKHVLKKGSRKPQRHPTDPFGFTKQFLEVYSVDADVSKVIRILEGQNLHSDSDVLRFLILNESAIPEQRG